MRFASMLRVDHVMGLHRLYWIPQGIPATQGMYVAYPADELYATLLVESHRCRCSVVGEDLGTVPDYVRPAMAEAGFHGLYVAQFSTEWREQEQQVGLQTPQASVVACIDTHDTATFAGWFATTDLSDPLDLLNAWIDELAAGPAAGFLINLEDLWLEPEPQNRPGTNEEVPNWRHRLARTLKQITCDESISIRLKEVDRLRSPES
jgi:4-alpha-glucanotransferase